MPPTLAPTTSSTSSDLLTLVRRHDPDGWDRFVSLYSPLVYGWSRRAGLNAADAADVVQEVFIAVFRSIGEFRRQRSSDTFRGWLRVICRNKLNDLFRRRGVSPQASGGTDANIAWGQLAEVEPDEATVISERRALARRAAELIRGEFEERTWQAFWLIAVEQQTAAETAQRLGITVGAARQAKYSVLRRLREYLSGEFD